MKNQGNGKQEASRTTMGLRVGTALLGLALVALPGAAAAERRLAEEEGSAAGIHGAWAITVTLRDCATGAPLGPAFPSLVTYAAGGTLVESAGGGAFAPGQRSDGHGTWTRQDGSSYVSRIVALLHFSTDPQPPAPGFEAGWQIVDHKVQLIGHEFLTSQGTVRFYDAEGALYRSGCSSAVGERIE
jgi:hypothetical protein